MPSASWSGAIAAAAAASSVQLTLSEGPTGLVATVTPPDAPPVSLDLGPAPRLRERAHAWARAMAEGSDEADVLGAPLADALWAPVAPHVVGHEQVTLDIAGWPDMPWAALPWRGGYLVEQHELAILPAAPAAPSPAAAAGTGLLLVGDIAYGEGTGVGPAACWAGPLPPLVHTASELKAIADIWARSGRADERVRSLTGTAATEGQVSAALPGNRVIHLATHGFFLTGACAETLGVDRIDPMLRNGVALAGANEGDPSGPADGLFTAQEAASLDLRGTRLVVLSASVTALGKVVPGEGVQGLSRAFRTAGAQAVVASLWAVPDAETAWLMSVFYDELLGPDPKPPAAAMRAAQLKQLEAERARGAAQPQSWAQWVIVGQ